MGRTKTNRTELVAVLFDAETKEKIKEIAAECRRDMSDYVRLIIEDAVKARVRV